MSIPVTNKSLGGLSDLTISKAPNAIFWVDSKGSIKHANQAACKRFGYGEKELTTMMVYEINTFLSKKGWPKFWKALKKDKVVGIEVAHLTKSGKKIPSEISAHLISYAGKDYMCSFVIDITERKSAEIELKEAHRLLKLSSEKKIAVSEDKFRKVFEHSNDAIFIVDPSKEAIVDSNPKASKMLGYTKKEMLKMSMADIHPHEMPRLHVFAESVFNKKSGWTDELSCKTKTGSILPAEISASILELSGSTFMIALIRDISKRKEYEQALLDANEHLEARVGERTQKLLDTNKLLEAAMEEVERLKNRLEAENVYLQEEIKLNHNFEEIISVSEVFKKVLKKVEQVASTDATVLILGETGTGKELLARAVHNISTRRNRPLVKVNCGALPSELIESELFGHEKGAFTGAHAQRIGRFELANGGTVFLDEIGELSLELQVKLLRVLQEGEFERLGSSVTRRINVRIIAATNRVLEKLMESGEFRSDLYYRLNVFPIVSPPLRQRVKDIPVLVRHFVAKYAGKVGKKIFTISQEGINQLSAYSWPGNIRELENVVERAVIVSDGEQLNIRDILPQNTRAPGDDDLLMLDEVERKHIVRVLEATGWKVSGANGAAVRLGLKPTTLEARLKKLGISRSVNNSQ